MSQDSREHDDDRADDGPLNVPDEALPEDVRPAEDNPLAQPADDDVPDDLLTQDVGHSDSGGRPEDASASGTGDAVGDGDTPAASPDETSSGTGSDA